MNRFSIGLFIGGMALAALGMSFKSSDGLTVVDGALVVTKSIQSYQGSLSWSSTLNLNFDDTTTVKSTTMGGDTTFTTSNLQTNRAYRLKIIGAATNCTPTFPAWKFLGGAPSVITASQVGMLSLEAWGTADTDVIAAYSESQ